MRDLMHQKYFLKTMYEACELRINEIENIICSYNDTSRLQELNREKKEVEKQKREIAVRIISIDDSLRDIL